jgi:predicted transcriptional regulator
MPTPQDTPKYPDVFEKIPVPPEVIEEALRTFNEAEILEALREIQEGKGLTYEESLARLRRLAAKADPAQPA